MSTGGSTHGGSAAGVLGGNVSHPGPGCHNRTSWGNGLGGNFYGQLGNGTTTEFSTTPVHVSSLSGVQDIAAGDYHGLALKDDGTVWGWGNNYFGQLGNGVGLSEFVGHPPVQVNGLSDVQDIAGGGHYSLALSSPTAPQTKADCKNGGWKDFGFKNQGQCIKAVTVKN